MAGKITTNSVVLGDSATDTQNFILKTNVDGTATLARGAAGTLGTVFGVNGSSAITGATLVTPALGTPASGVLTNCTGVPSAALPAGSVLQVVQGSYSTQVNNSTSVYVDTGLAATITPKFATSKILVSVSQLLYKSAGNTQNGVNVKLFRGATDLGHFIYVLGYTNSLLEVYGQGSIQYLDSPSTTSATTYKTQFASQSNAALAGAQQGNTGVSTITLMEIAG
jgi:hypothetical protein